MSRLAPSMVPQPVNSHTSVKTKATSTQIRRDKKSTYIVAENENYDLIDDDDEIIAYPTEWEEVKKEMNLIYFDEEEEGEI